MTTAVCIAAEALVIVILLAALIYGQPAALDAQRVQVGVQATRIHAQETQIAVLQPTVRPCRVYAYPQC